MTETRQRTLALILAVVLAAGAAFAVGRFTALSASTPPATPSNVSADAGFARDMKTHHGQAVAMAMTIYRKTEDEDLRLLAFDIATSQQSQIGTMSEWLIDWNLPALGGAPMAWMSGEHSHGTALTVAEAQAAMGMASTAELQALDAATGSEADCLFLSLMIRHHQGAVEMVDAIQELGSEPRVLQLSQQMGNAQQGELEVMQSMQSTLGCSAAG